MNNPLVSIIIPVYNRGHIISTTLDSILAQTYTNWECIVVDDISEDNTVEVVKEYCAKDKRFSFYLRPKSRKRGGNAARNYGFEKSKGIYVNWFDSDDFMRPIFLDVKLNAFHSNENLDFVVSKSIKFFEQGHIEEIAYYKDISKYTLNVDNFIQEKIHWLTPDLMIKRSCLEQIGFDESLKSGQEYNFIIRVLAENKLNGVFVDEILSNIRSHINSIQSIQNRNRLIAFKNKYLVAITTFESVYNSITDTSKLFFISRIFKLTTPLLLDKQWPPHYKKFLILYSRKSGVLKLGWLLIHSIFMLLFGINSYKLRKRASVL